MPREVREIEGICPNGFSEELFANREPVLLRGLVSRWPAVLAAKSSNQAISDYLKQFCSEKTVVCYSAELEKHGRFFYSDDLKRLDFESFKLPLASVLDLLISAEKERNSKTLYVGSTTVDICLPGFRNENDLPISTLDPLVSIWLGSQSKVAAHFDAPDNIACCVAGKRRFQLLPVEQLKNIYVGPLEFNPSGQAISLVDFSSPDYEKFPRFREAEEVMLVADLEPGDALYIPSMWWHQVEALAEFNILVNYWWRSVERYVDPGINALVYSILCIRDLPAHEKSAWKELFDYYIFETQQSKYDHIPEAARGFLSAMNEKLSRKLRTWLINRLSR